MTIKQLLDTYPLTAESITSFLTRKLVDSVESSGESIPEDFKRTMMSMSISIDKVETFIEENPRLLFDFFDTQTIYVETHRAKSKFYCKIGETTGLSNFNRLVCETQAVKDCFPLLEELLTKNKERQQNGEEKN